MARADGRTRRRSSTSSLPRGRGLRTGAELAFADQLARPRKIHGRLGARRRGRKRSTGSSEARRCTVPGPPWSPGRTKKLPVPRLPRRTPTPHVTAPGRPSNPTESRELTPHEDEIAHFSPGPWAADGSGFFLFSDEGRDSSASPSCASQNHADGSRLRTATSKGGALRGRPRARLEGQRGRLDSLRLHARETATDDPDPRCPAARTGYWLAGLTFEPGRPQDRPLLNSNPRPPDFYVVDSNRQTAPDHRRLPWRNRETDLVEPELIPFPTFDGREIPAWLYRPGRAVRPSSSRSTADRRRRSGPVRRLSVPLEPGIGVLAPNIRGSTGYGKTYQKLIHRDWGGADLRTSTRGA